MQILIEVFCRPAITTEEAVWSALTKTRNMYPEFGLGSEDKLFSLNVQAAGPDEFQSFVTSVRFITGPQKNVEEVDACTAFARFMYESMFSDKSEHVASSDDGGLSDIEDSSEFRRWMNE